MSARAEHWQRVEPGTVIPAGQPWRVCVENHADHDREVPEHHPGHEYQVDSSWRPPLELPTEPTWGIVVRPAGRAELGCWEWMTNGSHMLADNTHWFGPRDRADVADFIPLTDEQVARIEAAR